MCPSGYRYSDFQVGDGVSGLCVGEQPDAGVDAGSDALLDGGLDAGLDAPVDGMETDGGTLCRTRLVFADGKAPVFAEGPNSGRREVWISNSDGSGLINVSNDPEHDDFNPVWSPNGTKLAFVSNRSGKDDIFVANADGTGLSNLTLMLRDRGVLVSAIQPVWSPDGARIAFVAGGSSGTLYVMNADGSGPAQVAPFPPGIFNVYAWSPDGTKLVYTAGPSSPQLFTVAVGTGASPVRLITGTSFGSNAQWGPAETILFDNGHDLFAVNPDGTNLINLTQDVEADDTRAVRRGDQIIFTSTRNNMRPELWLRAGNAAPTRLTTNEVANSRDLAEDIAPDGSLVVYTRNTTVANGSVTTVVIEGRLIDIDGSNDRSLTTPGGAPREFSFSVCQ